MISSRYTYLVHVGVIAPTTPTPPPLGSPEQLCAELDHWLRNHQGLFGNRLPVYRNVISGDARHSREIRSPHLHRPLGQMLLTLLHEIKRPFLRCHLGDVAGQRIPAVFVRRTLVRVRRAPDVAVDGRLEERRVPDPISGGLLLRGRECLDPVARRILREDVPASCITFLSEQAFAPQNTRFWSRSRVWFQFTVGEDKPPMLSVDNRGKGVLSMDCSAKRSPF